MTNGQRGNQPKSSPQARQSCCSIIELRQYTLGHGKRDVMIELFEREFIESQETLGMTLVGQREVLRLSPTARSRLRWEAT